MVRDEGGSVLATASRRTPASGARAPARAPARAARAWSGAASDDGANPYAGLLGWADRIVCTADSVNMLSRSRARRCAPVFVAGVERVDGRPRRFLDSLLAARPHPSRSDDGARRLSRSTPLRETARVAAQVRARLGCSSASPTPARGSSKSSPCAARASRIAARAVAIASSSGTRRGRRSSVQSSPRVEQHRMRPQQRIALRRRSSQRACAPSPSISSGRVARLPASRWCCAECASTSVLQQELQVDQPALALLEVERGRIAAIEFGAHAPAHRHHVVAQRGGIARARQRLRAHALEVGAQRRHRRRRSARAPAPGVPRSRRARAGSRR